MHVYNYLDAASSQLQLPTASSFGWIVIHQKSTASGTFSWKLAWDSYKNGFNSTDGNNFWLGLERVHQLTSSAAYKLRIELQDSAASLWHSVEYWSFTVGDELTAKYAISIDGYEFF